MVTVCDRIWIWFQPESVCMLTNAKSQRNTLTLTVRNKKNTLNSSTYLKNVKNCFLKKDNWRAFISLLCVTVLKVLSKETLNQLKVAIKLSNSRLWWCGRESGGDEDGVQKQRMQLYALSTNYSAISSRRQIRSGQAVGGPFWAIIGAGK